MEFKIIIVSEIRNKFFDLTEIIPEMVSAENVSEEWAIDYFMSELEGSRYMKFPKYTQTKVIADWITQDMICSQYKKPSV